MVHSAAYQSHEQQWVVYHSELSSTLWMDIQLAELFIVFDLLCMRAMVLRIGFAHLSISQSVSL